MKKLFACLLALMLTLSLTACSLAEQPAADLDLAALSDAELAELAEAKQAAALPERCTDVAPAAETMPAKP